jgi:methionyl-tRNA formyltransferase
MLTDAPAGLDTLFPETRGSIAPLLRAYEPDLAICTGFPWLIPADALAVPRLGIVNGHPSLLPRYRGPFPVAWAVRNGEQEIGLTYHLMDAAFDTGPVLAQTSLALGADETWEGLQGRFGEAAPALLTEVFERLARGDRGDPQVGEGEYQSAFEDDYRFVDLTQAAADVHRQARAWSFMPPILPEPGPILERDGTRIRLLRTSLTEVAGAERLDCADGPLWIVETASV